MSLFDRIQMHYPCTIIVLFVLDKNRVWDGKKIKMFALADPGKGCERKCDTRVEASDDGEKGCGKSTERHGRGTQSTSGGEALTGVATVEAAADAK